MPNEVSMKSVNLPDRSLSSLKKVTFFNYSMNRISAVKIEVRQLLLHSTTVFPGLLFPPYHSWLWSVFFVFKCLIQKHPAPAFILGGFDLF